MSTNLPPPSEPLPGGGGQPPPPPRGPKVDVLRPYWDRPVTGLILQRALSYTAVHFLDERTVEHTEPAAKCAGCMRGVKKEGRGYLLILTGPPSSLAIAEITDYAISYCPRLYTSDLAGRRVRVRRLRQSRRSKTACEVGDTVETLPPGLDLVDPLSVMRRLWSAPSRRDRPARGDEDGLIPT